MTRSSFPKTHSLRVRIKFFNITFCYDLLLMSRSPARNRRDGSMTRGDESRRHSSSRRGDRRSSTVSARRVKNAFDVINRELNTSGGTPREKRSKTYHKSPAGFPEGVEYVVGDWLCPSRGCEGYVNGKNDTNCLHCSRHAPGPHTLKCTLGTDIQLSPPISSPCFR